MILRRYFASHAVETLKTKTLMVSSPLAFDDVYDCRPNIVQVNEDNFYDHYRAMCLRTGSPLLILNEEKKRFVIEQMNSGSEELARETMEKHTRICCFENPIDADANSEARLWREYTHHKGVRLSFDIDIEHCNSFFMEKVNYIDSAEERPPIDFSTVYPNSNDYDSVSLMRKIVCYKLTKYQFEHEYRLITMPHKCHGEFIRNNDQRMVSSFLDFSKLFEVCAIDFGLRCPDRDIIQIFKLLKKDEAYRKTKIPIRKMISIADGKIRYTPISTLSDLSFCHF